MLVGSGNPLCPYSAFYLAKRCYSVFYNHKMNQTSNLLTRITQTPGQCGGRPCIRGMRIRVSDIVEMLAENVSVTEILEDFPDLELKDIQACLLL